MNCKSCGWVPTEHLNVRLQPHMAHTEELLQYIAHLLEHVLADDWEEGE